MMKQFGIFVVLLILMLSGDETESETPSVGKEEEGSRKLTHTPYFAIFFINWYLIALGYVLQNLKLATCFLLTFRHFRCYGAESLPYIFSVYSLSRNVVQIRAISRLYLERKHG